MKSGQIKEITEKATEQLATALKAGHSQTLTDYLKAIGRFHRYRLHNVLLIGSQKPNASYVAGFRNWNELGRFVKKGENGILILAPVGKELRVARTAVLNLKTSEFKILTRSHTPSAPPSSCEELTSIALSLRQRLTLSPKQRFRLVGVGLSNFHDPNDASAQPALFE
jgi:nucleotidyltransferase/DNA polymerase involved in DNA repair